MMGLIGRNSRRFSFFFRPIAATQFCVCWQNDFPHTVVQRFELCALTPLPLCAFALAHAHAHALTRG